jgi:hypothetical protein
VLLLAFGLTSCRTAPAPTDTEPPSDGPPQGAAATGCQPSFPDRGGWLGGDAAFSVPLPDRGPGASLWLFGDTFVARGETSERRFPFVANSIGLSRCGADGFALETFWSRGDGDEPRGFFVPRPGEGSPGRPRSELWYWPFGGFFSADTLFVGLLRVRPAAPRGPYRLPFRLTGMDLARIENHREPPDRWRIEIVPFSRHPRAMPGAAFVVHEDWLYAFGFFDGHEGHVGRSPRFLARLPLAALAVPARPLVEAWQTFDRTGRWIAGLRPETARLLMTDDATEMSVHRDPTSDRWLAVYAESVPDGDTDRPDPVWWRSASRLEGPWSPRQILFEIPETRPGTDPNLFCYAAKAHPQLARPGRLLVTYVCNLFARNETETLAVLQRLTESPSLYRARAVSVPIPGPSSSSISRGASESD